MFPTWELPVRGHVGELVTESDVDGQVLRGESVCHVPLPGSGGAAVVCEGRVLGGFERIRLNRKTPAQLAGYVVWEVSRLVPGFGRD